MPASWPIEAAAVVLLCACFAYFVISHARASSATYDETAHLPAGYSYLLWHDYRMNPEHPPLLKLWAALPLLRLQVWPSRYAMEQQDASDPLTLVMAKAAWAMGLHDVTMQWWFGHCLLFGVRDEPLKRFNIAEPLMLPTAPVVEKNDYFNDADLLLFRGRMQILLLGLLLALMVFFWARELYGPAGGVLALAFFCFDPNFIAHSGLVTTDAGVAAFIFAALFFFRRACRKLDAVNVVFLLLFTGAACSSKYSGALLLPLFAIIGTARIALCQEWHVTFKARRTFSTMASKAAALGAVMALSVAASWGMVWAVYGFRYSAAADPGRAALVEKQVLPPGALSERKAGHLPIEQVVRRTAAIQSLRNTYPQQVPEEKILKAIGTVPHGVIGGILLFARDKKLLPEAYLYGFAFARMKSLNRGSFLLGRHSNRGFWYYFPAAFMLKTPLLTIVALIAALFLALRRKKTGRYELAFLMVPAGLFLLAPAMTNLNIGHRHLLNAYPFLFVVCGGCALEWLRWGHRRRKTLAAAAAVCALAANSLFVFAPPWKPAAVFPHYLAYFNELAGGPRNGHKALVDSNLDWGQGLKELSEWTRTHGISEHEPLNLCYFGTADPRYYRIPHVKLPGGYAFEPPERRDETFGIAHIPGYVAISATHLQGAYFSPRQRAHWCAFLKNAVPADTLGYSIFIYRIDRL